MSKLILVNEEALRAVLNALVNAPHQIRELQATREPVALFKDNPINILIEQFNSGGRLTGAGFDVLTERQRQVSAEGWTAEHDDAHIDCSLAAAAATYALCTSPAQLKVCGAVAWPWPSHWWKPTSYRQNLVKAGALILAEIERLDRKLPPMSENGDS